MIRLGVDAWNLPYDRRGIGRYVRALLRAWTADAAERVAPVLVVPETPAWWHARRYRAAADGLALPVVSRAAAQRRGLDALWFPFNGPSWDGWRGPGIATLHDASTFDLDGFGDDARATFRRAAAACAALVTDSAFSRERLALALGLPATRFDVVHLGVAPPRAPAPVALDLAALGRYVLFVGEAEPRKGLPELARAVAALRAEGRDVTLAVVGRLPSGAPEGAHVRALGAVDDATLAALYRGCAVFAYPSRYEGFGLPVLEAMAHGAPVVAADAGAIPEAGGDAVRYVPPGEVDALAAALAAVLDEPALADALRGRGRARAAAMTWARTAEATLQVIERAVAENRA